MAALVSEPLFLTHGIARAASVGQLAAARAAFPEMARLLLDGGVRGYDLARIAAETGDRLARRVLGLAEAELGPPRRYCWLALSSEAAASRRSTSTRITAWATRTPRPRRPSGARPSSSRSAGECPRSWSGAASRAARVG